MNRKGPPAELPFKTPIEFLRVAEKSLPNGLMEGLPGTRMTRVKM
jgi:hypothetical protein